MGFDVAGAKTYIASLDVVGLPRGLVAQDAQTDTGTVFDQAKAQAQVVGSGLFSFSQGVDASVREAISDSALLAQLVANKKGSVEDDPTSWFKNYSDVLQNVGWTLQDGGWTDYTSEGTAAEVHQKIIEVLTVALGPAPAALAILTSALNALQAMNSDSPWITLFNRESQHAKIARFQIGLVDTSATGDVFVSLLGCLIVADSTITQVLFFKFRNANARFKADSAKVSINRAALADLGPAIRAKVRAYQFDYVSSVLDV
jgi:hypothetical protein